MKKLVVFLFFIAISSINVSSVIGVPLRITSDYYVEMLLVDYKGIRGGYDYVNAFSDYTVNDFDVNKANWSYIFTIPIIRDIFNKHGMNIDDLNTINEGCLKDASNELLHIPNLIELIDKKEGIAHAQKWDADEASKTANKLQLAQNYLFGPMVKSPIIHESDEYPYGQEGDVAPYRGLEVWHPVNSVYRVHLYGKKNTHYTNEITCRNELMQDTDITLEGAILQGEVQDLEIVYEYISGKPTTAKKVFTLDSYENEVNILLKRKADGLQEIKGELLKGIKEAKKNYGTDKAKAAECIAGILEALSKARKEYLIKAGKPVDLAEVVTYPRYQGQEWYEKNMLQFDILIFNGNELLKQLNDNEGQQKNQGNSVE